jgi:hypothetical protein
MRPIKSQWNQVSMEAATRDRAKMHLALTQVNRHRSMSIIGRTVLPLTGVVSPIAMVRPLLTLIRFQQGYPV